jgi:adenylylsulfate reductase, subunit A
MFREETRWPGYYFRADKPKMDQANWKYFANCKYDPKGKEWTMAKRTIHDLIPV